MQTPLRRMRAIWKGAVRPEELEMEWLLRGNEAILAGCRVHGCDVVLIDTEYDPDELLRQFG